MKKPLLYLCIVCFAALIGSLSFADQPAVNTQTTERLEYPAVPDRLESLKIEIESLIQAREHALQDIQLRYEAALPEDRTGIEQEGADLNADYDRAYLELIAEYHRLTGNEAELAEAERQLEQIHAGVVTGTPLPLDRNRSETITENSEEVNEHE